MNLRVDDIGKKKFDNHYNRLGNFQSMDTSFDNEIGRNCTRKRMWNFPHIYSLLYVIQIDESEFNAKAISLFFLTISKLEKTVIEALVGQVRVPSNLIPSRTPFFTYGHEPNSSPLLRLNSDIETTQTNLILI